MQARIAPSLGDLEGTHHEVWGTREYTDPNKATIFMGLYGLPDFYTLWRNKGGRAILWCGTDILHFTNGYWLDEKGSIRIDPQPLAEWINANCESYVENGVEHEALMQFGIESKIVPSFMGQVKDYDIEYTWNSRPQVYASVSGDNFAMYGWELIEKIANHCDVDFHLYGNVGEWVSKHSNVFVHGRVPKEQMNEEIKHMHCGLRTLEFDGFSEILAKSVLWGQYPISYISYPHIDTYTTNEQLISLLNSLVEKTTPNLKARSYYQNALNRFPWNSN